MRHFFLCAVTLLFCFPFSCGYAQEAISTPILSSAPNFRDLAGISALYGGTGYADTTSNGGVMRTGVFYRTDALSSLSTADQATLSSLHIDRDIDLRTPSEIASNPDIVPNGTIFTNINIYGTPNPPPQPPFSNSIAPAISYMEGLYSNFVADPVDRDGFRTVLLTLANDSGPDLYHCSAGKDRTGWTSVILESIAGVPQATIMQDYLATNLYTAKLIAYTWAQLQTTLPSKDADVVLGVQPYYLQTALDQVSALYGSMNAYLTRGLGLTQADIYVLRAKMVYYQTLPGQNTFSGNAAAGAGLLNALQNSPLSGRYTAYNYYLQSAIDAGTLGGVQARVGGQVHADAASFLLRRSQWIDEAIAPYASGRDLQDGRTRFWMSGLGGGFWTGGSGGASSSTEHNAGTLEGLTRRCNDQTSADLGLGYDWGSVASAGASATVETFLATVGGRYGFSSLDAGPFLSARADAGSVQYESTRVLGAGLGEANGKTNGAFYGGLATFGDVIRLAPFTVTLQTGIRVSGVSLDRFRENGSELALDVGGIDKTYSSLLFDLGVDLDRRQLGQWSVVPAISFGYERVLANPRVESTGTIYGYSVSQYSAFDSRDLAHAGVNVRAERGAILVKAGVDGFLGGAAESTGVDGQASVSYRF
ncbi:MAG: tyrosine-protein phosphatase [Syntrophobacteraceae bacterium]